MAGELLADVVFVMGQEDGSIPGICTHLLYEFPEIVAVAISPSDHCATVFRRVNTAEKFEALTLEQGLARVLDSVSSLCRLREDSDPR